MFFRLSEGKVKLTVEDETNSGFLNVSLEGYHNFEEMSLYKDDVKNLWTDMGHWLQDQEVKEK